MNPETEKSPTPAVSNGREIGDATNTRDSDIMSKSIASIRGRGQIQGGRSGRGGHQGF